MGKTPRKPATKKATPAKAKLAKAKPTARMPATEKNAVPKRPARTPRAKATVEDPVKQAVLKAAQYAIEKKAENVRLLDLRDITTMTDFFLIATGPSQPQVKAIAENVIKEMRDTEGMAPWRSEGWESMEWVLIDFVDFVVHIFQPAARQYYNVERLWADAPVIDVEDTAKPKRAKRAPKATETAPKRNTSGVRVISDFKQVK